MNLRRSLLLLVCFLSLAPVPPVRGSEAQPAPAGRPAMPVAIPSPADLLARLRPGHPRLLATAEDFAQLKARVATDAPSRRWLDALRAQAQDLLRASPSRYEIPDGLRLLATSRRVLHRVQTLALLHRLEGDARWLERAWRELEAAAAFPDWNPKHFLDTAEMTHAFALAYDWSYDAWTPAQRATLRAAMVEKGLTPALKIAQEQRWWATSRHNWNQVCNGGIGLGALALADVEPALAGEFLHAAARSIQLAMTEFAPDGAWAEGPGYWNYATTYNVAFLAALETALGTDLGLSQIEGFADAGMFPLYLTGPLGRTFNYADGGDGTIRAPHMFWLARRFDRPAYAAYQQAIASPHPLDLVWGAPELRERTAPALPLDRYFRHAEVVTLRSAWNDPQAVFVGFKAGDNKANHSNLDLGTFVLDALGVRWAVDLGADDYNLPGYFGGQRWNYYRLRAEGHNTLVLNPGPEPDQDPRAATKIVRFSSRDDRALAVADLTPAYAKHARRVQRGVALLERRRVLVQDELETAQPSSAWWFLHTPADVTLRDDGRAATLNRDGKHLAVALLSPAGARFTVRDATPLPGAPAPERQARNQGIRKLAIELPAAAQTRLAVLLTPGPDSVARPTPAWALQPLADWP